MFREYLDKLRENNLVETVEKQISRTYEIGQYLEDFDNDKMVEFTNIEGSDYKLLGNICASRICINNLKSYIAQCSICIYWIITRQNKINSSRQC